MNVNIEYCVKWNYGPEFDRVSKIIKSVDKCITINGNSNPPRSGAFEIEIDSVLVKSGIHKDLTQINNLIKNHQINPTYIIDKFSI